MRTVVGVALAIICLGLAGCSLFGKKQTARNNNTSNPKPFTGAEGPPKAETAALPRNFDRALPGANGMLAGRVIAESSGQPVQAVIRVINLNEDDTKAADLDVWTNSDGYFTISGLKVGCHYELIARAKDGSDLVSGMVVKKPPNPSVLLEIDKRFTSAKTPPVPDAPKVPEKKSTAGADNTGEPASAVGIGPPQSRNDADAPPRVNVNAPIPDNGGAPAGGGQSPDPANIADGGFTRIRPPVVDIPGDIPKKPWPPPLPRNSQWENAPNEQPSQPAPPPKAPGAVQLPHMPTKINSCVLLGGRLNNFALYDVDGRVWEYQRNKNKQSRLTLLDFWHHQCHHCLTGMHQLVKLQREYGPYGLEVIGIACERGPVQQQHANVISVRGRYNINYPLLLSGGSKSPIENQFQVEYFPLLVLLDENGTIIWRSTDKGMDDFAYENLRRMINNRLITQAQP